VYDTIGVIMCKLLFDAGTVRKGRQNNCLHGAILGKGAGAVKDESSLHVYLYAHQIERPCTR
jgi:hypothetical protein